MSDTQKPAVGRAWNPGPRSSPGRNLAIELIDRLRRGAARKLTRSSRSEGEAVALARELEVSARLPVDKAAYAIALGYCLAPHFPTVTSLLATTAFVVIRARSGDDAGMLGDVFAEVAVLEWGGVAHNPHQGLGEEDRLVVLGDAGVRQSHNSMRVVSQAAEKCLPLFCTISTDDPIPAALAGGDLELQLPPMNSEMLALLFEATHDEIPAGVSSFSSAKKLRTPNLVAHVRRGRPATDCLSGLIQSVTPRRATAPKAGTIQLHDLAGYGAAKAWGLELALDLESWRGGHLNWSQVDHRAVVLAGPPGTGKTSFAGVLAANLRVPLISTSVAEWNARDNLSGTLKRMQAVFDQAVEQAPCVLFIDELDGISSRSNIEGRYSEYWTQVVNRMLELVTNTLLTDGVVIVGATNHVERIDPALTRSGRLDEIIRIELPDAEAITAILCRYCGLDNTGDELSKLAPRLIGRSGADIEKLVRSAKASARRAGHTFSLRDVQAQVTDPLEALPPRTRRRVEVYRSGQRIVAEVLGLADMTVTPQQQEWPQLLAKGLAEERFPTEQVCNDVLCVILAGRAAEEIVFGDVSSFGAASADSDLAAATRIATDMELKAGFGEPGVIYLGELNPASKLTAAAIAGVRRRLEGALARASSLLLENVAELDSSNWRDARDIAAAAHHLKLLN